VLIAASRVCCRPCIAASRELTKAVWLHTAARIWPGSHTLLHRQNPVFANLMEATQFKEWDESERTWAGHPYVHCRWKDAYAEDYAAVADWVGKNIEPIEFNGGEGDVLIWHSRCFHAGSRNFSGSADASDQPYIRQAVFYDCHRADMLSSATAHNSSSAGGSSQWLEWSPAVQEAAASLPQPLIVGGPELSQPSETERGQLMGPTEGALGARQAAKL
jgi:hypothetical protein